MLAPPNWGIGRACNSLVYSEQFRSACETRRSRYGRLTMRQTDSGGGRSSMKRREFISLLGGAAVGWPFVAHAQQVGRLPIIGFLGADASAFSPWTAAFVTHLRELGWIENRNVAIEYRWSEGRTERYAEIAAEFARLKVDVILTVGSAVPTVRQVTSVIPLFSALRLTRSVVDWSQALLNPAGT